MKIKDLEKIEGIVSIHGSFMEDEILLTTDSRSVQDQNVFIALVGESFDGFSYVDNILGKSIKVVIYTEVVNRNEEVIKLSKKYSQVLFIAVKDTTKFLQNASAWWVREWQKNNDGTVLGLTGSNGKTTTKELIYALAKEILPNEVTCTLGNLNNHIGVPLTIFKITNQHKFAIVEMGTNHPGEIEELCQIANPNYGLITNIGAAHLEFFKTEEGVLKEKSALYRYIVKSGTKFYLNIEDDHLKNLAQGQKVLTYQASTFSVELRNLNIKEDFNLWNLNTALFVMSDIFKEHKLKFEEIVSYVSLPDNKRSQWVDLKNQRIFLDAYNANPSSMKESLASFHKSTNHTGAKSLFVLGDMNELGDKSCEYHQAVGRQLNDLGVLHAIFVGKFASDYNRFFLGRATCYLEIADLRSEWAKVSNSYQYIFLKGSRSLQLESLLDITV